MSHPFCACYWVITSIGRWAHFCWKTNWLSWSVLRYTWLRNYPATTHFLRCFSVMAMSNQLAQSLVTSAYLCKVYSQGIHHYGWCHLASPSDSTWTKRQSTLSRGDPWHQSQMLTCADCSFCSKMMQRHPFLLFVGFSHPEVACIYSWLWGWASWTKPSHFICFIIWSYVCENCLGGDLFQLSFISLVFSPLLSEFLV